MSQTHSDRETSIGKAIYAWFHQLQDNPGKRAELRRCESLDEIFFCQGYWDLRNALSRTSKNDFDNKQTASIAALAGILAKTREWPNATQPMGRAFAQPGGEARGLSALRFRRLLTAKKIADLFIPLSRALKLIKFKFPPTTLAKDLWYWGETTKKRWALDYYSQLNEN